ncbi:MAG: hypothetical protein SFU83_05240 [Meiothermus sp.]|nr:hypothetical protein [Meiothermus sp.]
MVEAPEATRRYALALARAYLGLDQLHRAANPEDPWGLVVLELERLEPEPFPDFAAAKVRFNELRGQARSLLEPDRRTYYLALCGSALAVIEWNTQGLGLEAQIEGFLAAPPRPASEAELEEIRGKLHGLLGGMGYAGDLAQRATAWEARHRVEPEQIEQTMLMLTDEARGRSEAVFWPIECPDPQIKIVSGAAFNARCDYARLTVEVNRDPVLTRQSLKHLVIHEIFPGHCLQFETRRRAYLEGWGYADGLLSLVKSAGSPLFEGVADSGGHLLDWEDADDKVQALLTNYRAGLGTVAAWGLHKLGWSRDQAADYLHRNSLSGGAGWVDNRLGYIAPKGRGAHVWSYWLGERRLRSLVAPRPPRALAQKLYGRMHSLESVALIV